MRFVFLKFAYNHSMIASHPFLPLNGIIPPLVTPLLNPFTLDEVGLSRLLEHTIAGGVHGLFLLGTTGEGPALRYQLRREIIARTCQQVKGRVPVLVAITDTSLEESLELGRWARHCGASALVVSAPYYFAVSQSDLYRMVELLAGGIDLPLFLYNMPSRTRAVFAPETVQACAKIPNVAGLKDSSGDMDYLKTLVALFRDRPDFSILCGPEEQLSEAMALGAVGGVNGGANLFPRLFVRLYEALASGNLAAAEPLQQAVQQLSNMLYHIGEEESCYLRGLKLGMELMGICQSQMTAPFECANPADFADLKENLKQFQIF